VTSCGRGRAGERDELVAGFGAGIAMLTAVLDEGRFDPRGWRAEGALPDKP
jgi:hypothetical protein